MLIKKVQQLDQLLQIKSFLSNLRDYYQNFDSWFDDKVLKDLKTDRFVFAAYDVDENILGVLILKKSETKICTFFIREENRFDHIGGDFLQIAYDTLQSEKLKLSVSDEVKHEFFNNKQFNFVCEKELQDVYKIGTIEYFGYIQFHYNYAFLKLLKKYKIDYRLTALIKKKLSKDLIEKLQQENVKIFQIPEFDLITD